MLLSAIIVPGTANPYLADPANDPKTPANPALWKDGTAPPSIDVTGGNLLTFSVTGSTTNEPGAAQTSPDGGPFQGKPLIPANFGARGDVSSWDLPIDSLAGIFEGATLGAAPVPYAGSLSAQSVSPLLGQVFFIGDGLTGTGTGSVQVFHVPAGATHLYFANIDGEQWGNNGGQFSVQVTSLEAQIDINKTAGRGDNVTVFNSDATGEHWAQTIPASITNVTTSTQTFQLSVNPPSDATINQTSVTLRLARARKSRSRLRLTALPPMTFTSSPSRGALVSAKTI